MSEMTKERREKLRDKHRRFDTEAPDSFWLGKAFDEWWFPMDVLSHYEECQRLLPILLDALDAMEAERDEARRLAEKWNVVLRGSVCGHGFIYPDCEHCHLDGVLPWESCTRQTIAEQAAELGRLRAEVNAAAEMRYEQLVERAELLKEQAAIQAEVERMREFIEATDNVGEFREWCYR